MTSVIAGIETSISSLRCGDSDEVMGNDTCRYCRV